MKLRKASTGHGDVPLRGGSGAPPCTFFSLSASAKAFLKASEDGSKFDRRSQYKILIMKQHNDNWTKILESPHLLSVDPLQASKDGK